MHWAEQISIVVLLWLTMATLAAAVGIRQSNGQWPSSRDIGLFYLYNTIGGVGMAVCSIIMDRADRHYQETQSRSRSSARALPRRAVSPATRRSARLLARRKQPIGDTS